MHIPKRVPKAAILFLALLLGGPGGCVSTAVGVAAGATVAVGKAAVGTTAKVGKTVVTAPVKAGGALIGDDEDEKDED